MQWSVFIVERDLPNYSKQQYDTRFTFSVCPNPKRILQCFSSFLWKAVLLAQPYPTNMINPDLESRNFRFLLFILVPTAFHCLLLIRSSRDAPYQKLDRLVPSMAWLSSFHNHVLKFSTQKWNDNTVTIIPLHGVVRT